MKKHHFILFILYASIIIISIVIVVLDSLNLHLKNLITDFWMGEQFVFSIVFFDSSSNDFIAFALGYFR